MTVIVIRNQNVVRGGRSDGIEPISERFLYNFIEVALNI
jgi:hypothetical protein